jgi:hypothetical protein
MENTSHGARTHARDGPGLLPIPFLLDNHQPPDDRSHMQADVSDRLKREVQLPNSPAHGRERQRA